MKYGRVAKIGTAPIVKMLKVARRPILSDTAAQPNRPTRFPDQEEKEIDMRKSTMKDAFNIFNKKYKKCWLR